MATILKNWSDDQIQRVWEKGTIIPDVDKNIYRQDTAGAWIKRSEYGNITDETNLGWEIDHLKPKSKQGTDDISNLRPFQWNNNRTKGDDYPNWCTSITHDDGQYIKNIKKNSALDDLKISRLLSMSIRGLSYCGSPFCNITQLKML